MLKKYEDCEKIFLLHRDVGVAVIVCLYGQDAAYVFLVIISVLVISSVPAC